jgi:hypothetical protein
VGIGRQSLIYGSRAMSFVAGPSAGGLMAQLLSAPVAIAADALSFLGSAFCLARIRPAEPPPSPDPGGVTDGLRLIARSSIVRPSLAGGAINYGTRPLGALLGGLLATELGLRAALWIAVIGGVAGAALLVPTRVPRFRLPA